MTLDNYSPVDLLMQHVAELDADVMVITAPPSEVRRRLCEQADASEGRVHVYNAWPLFVRSRMPITRVRVLVAADFMFITSLELDATTTLGRPIALDIIDLPSNPRLPAHGDCAKPGACSTRPPRRRPTSSWATSTSARQRVDQRGSSPECWTHSTSPATATGRASRDACRCITSITCW